MIRGEDELLAKVCSSHSPKALAVAAVTGMYGAGKYGKRLSDCFWDRAAKRTRSQTTHNPALERGRISLSITHAVGDKASAMVNALGFADVFGKEHIEQDYWDLVIDTPEGWEQHKVELTQRFHALALNNPVGLYKTAIDMYGSLENAWDMLKESGNPMVMTVAMVVVLSRVLNSYGRYYYFDKYPDLMKVLRGPDPFNDLLSWYGRKSKGKAKRARFMEAMVVHYGASIESLGGLNEPANANPVSTLRDAQTHLQMLGYYDGMIDGDFGKLSMHALGEWSDYNNHDFADIFVEGIYLLPYARDLMSEEKFRIMQEEYHAT